MILRLLVTAAGLLQNAWVVAGFLLSFRRWLPPLPDAVRTAWAELRPLYLPCVVVTLANDIAHGHIWGWNLIFHCGFVANWFFFKDVDDDDRWKRRGRKALEKIHATDRGLVVVAEPVSR